MSQDRMRYCWKSLMHRLLTAAADVLPKMRDLYCSGGKLPWMAILALASLPATAGVQIGSVLQPSAAISNVGGGCSYSTFVTPDGRYVLFASTSANLVTTRNGQPMQEAVPAHMNVFLRDRQTGLTQLVSVDTTGTAGGNGDSFPDAISTNGQFAFFESTASNLMAGASNAITEIYVRDTVNNITTLVSAGTNGAPGNGASHNAAITPDGRYAAFDSAATNLIAADTNGITDVFVRDLQLGATTLASVGAQSTTNAFNTALTLGSSSQNPVISVDGRYVAFFSTATGLVTNTTGVGELYVRDLFQGTTTWVSSNAHFLDPWAQPANYAMSTNGQWIAYQTTGRENAGLSTDGFVFRYNEVTGASDYISSNGVMVSSQDHDTREIDISADGRFVAYTLSVTYASAPNNNVSIQLWDAESGTNSLISTGTSNELADFPRFDQTGRYVAFLSGNPSIFTNEDDAVHIYLRDTLSGSIQLVDVGTDGVTPISSVSSPFAFCASAGAIAFNCPDGALSINSNKNDAFLRDLGANTTEIISAPVPTLPSVTPLNASGLTLSSSSSNGQYVAFSSSADGIVGTHTNGQPDVYVHDFVSGSNTLVSVALGGANPGNNFSFQPVISGNGRYVAFMSCATNLVANDSDQSADIFIHDLETGLTTLVSKGLNGSGAGNNQAFTPQISADGRHVLFCSFATNLTTNHFVLTIPTNNIFWWDMQSGITYAITTNGATTAAMTPNGSNVFFASGAKCYLWTATTHSAVSVESTAVLNVAEVAVSPNAQWAEFETAATSPPTTNCYAVNLVAKTNWPLSAITPTTQTLCQFSGNSQFMAYLAEDSVSNNQVRLYNFQTASSALVSQSYDSASGASAPCDSPAISSSGRYVAYRSAATNLVPNDNSSVPKIFLYDQWTGGTTLVSASQFGAFPANGRSLLPFFSADGQNLFFESWASDLAAGDFNEYSDVFALPLSTNGLGNSSNSLPPLEFTGISFGTTNGQFSDTQPVTLTWSSAPGFGYQVLFNDDLADPLWQPLDSPATVVGNQGQVFDLFPDPVHRFYRLVSF